MTDGGADYSFECVGDTGVVSTALQSCSGVISVLAFLCIHITVLIFLFSHLFAYISQFTYSIPVYSYAFPTCQGWGVTVTLGVPKAKPEVSAHYAFLLSGRTLKGSLFGGWRPKSDLPSLVDKYADKVLMKTSQETTVSKGEK